MIRSLAFLWAALAVLGQNPSSYTVATPRPINPSANTTNPSARATQGQNPYLGSTPAPVTNTTLELTLESAIERGIHYNLGLIESTTASVDASTDRMRALSRLLPNLSARAGQTYENLSLKEVGIRLPGLPPVTGGFGFQDARISISQSLFSAELHHRYRAEQAMEHASALSARDAREVVIFAAGTAFFQIVASASRLETAKAQLESAEEVDRQAKNQVKSEVAPEIDSLRAQVERQTAEQRVVNARNDLEKDKLTLGRIIGLDAAQKFTVRGAIPVRPLEGITEESATADALRSRADLASAKAAIEAAEYDLRAERSQRLPSAGFTANYGGGGANVANMKQVYTVSADVSVPLYTGGRIRADIERAVNELARRRAEYSDLRGRVAYDVRVAWLDLDGSQSSVTVAESNRQLAQRALGQARDRYANGVTNYLEVVEAQEAVAQAGENLIASEYSFNVAKLALARAMGAAEARTKEFFGND